MFEVLGKFAAAKAKEVVKDLANSMDLDHNGQKDVEQINKWIDSLGSLGSKVDDAIDQDKLMAVVKEATGTIKEILDYIEAVKNSDTK